MLAAATLLHPLTAGSDTLELVQSHPVGAEALGDPELREAHVVWPQMIRAARENIELAHFYASNRAGSRLETVIGELEAAADRGVQIRFLAEKGFHDTYPKTLDRLDAHEGIEVRLLDLRERWGGVLHAKFMVVDGRSLFVGSQNFDWRALEHIQELGARVESPALAAEFQRVFEFDWSWAGGETGGEEGSSPTPADPTPIALDHGAGAVRATAVFSPRDGLPAGAAWDLPRILALLDGAEYRIRVQLLSYEATGEDDRYWPDLETALRDAASRGVEVQMLLSHWNQREGRIEGLQSLQCLPGITIRLVTPPTDSGGFIPFARVIHSKFLVVDGERAWLGTSNWSRDYFHRSRNAGLILEGETIADDLDRFFERGWTSPWSATVRPGHDYPEPRIAE